MYSFPLPVAVQGDSVAGFDPTKTSSTRMAPIGAMAWYQHPTYGMQCYRHAKAG